MNKPKPNQKGFTVVEAVIILVVIIAIGGVGWLVYGKNHKKDNNESASATSAKQTSPETKLSSTAQPAKRVDPYAGWKSYTSKVSEYTVKYPSSWTIEGYDINANNPIPASQLTGNEGEGVLLFSSSSKTNSFGIWLNNDTKYETQTNASGSGFGPLAYSAGTDVKTLSNGMNVWEQTEQNAKAQQKYNPHVTPDFEVASSGKFGYKLKSGKYIRVSMGFGYAFKQGTTYTYSQQSGDPQLQQAESILSSIK